MTDVTVTLAARSLVERFGFDKGRLLDHLLDRLGYRPDEQVAVPTCEGTERAAFGHLVLRECVVRHLAPSLRGVGVRERLDLRPNPVRLDREPYGDAARRARALLDATTVVVSVAEVDRVAEDVARRHGIARRDGA